MINAFDDVAPAPKDYDKVDQSDVNDAQAVVPYLADIHRHYRESEVRCHT